MFLKKCDHCSWQITSNVLLAYLSHDLIFCHGCKILAFVKYNNKYSIENNRFHINKKTILPLVQETIPSTNQSLFMFEKCCKKLI